MSSDNKNKPWYKKSYIWVLLVIGVLIVAGIAAGDSSKTKDSSKTQTSQASTAAPKESKPAEPTKTKWDAAAIYAQIQTGMTKAQVEQITGKSSDNCSETAIQGYGTTEYCSYSGGFGDKGTISVVYNDGAVSSKSKIDF